MNTTGTPAPVPTYVLRPSAADLGAIRHLLADAARARKALGVQAVRLVEWSPERATYAAVTNN